MNQPASEHPLTRPPMHWPSLLIAVGGLLIICLLLGAAGFFLFGGLASFLGPQAVPGETTILFSYATAAVLIGLLILPVLVMAFKRLSGKPARPAGFLQAPGSLRWLRAAWWLFPLAVGAGAALNTWKDLDWLLIPGLSVLSLSLPVAALLWLGTKSLPPSSPQRNWTVFGMSMTLTPLIIIVIELLLIFIGAALLMVLLVVLMPDLAAEIQTLLGYYVDPLPGQQPLDQILQGLLERPGVIALALFFTAGLVPLIEESLKPLGVWLLAGRPLAPQDGWVLGLLSGAGFALVENLGNLSAGQDWIALVVARAGAAALHMFNSAIIGYTFVLARQKKRPRIAILTFLGTLAIHAIWNAAAILAALSALKDPTATGLGWPIGFLLLLAGAAIGMTIAIHRMDNQLAGEPEPETLEGENINA